MLYNPKKHTNGKHKGRVHCLVSDRWLQFPERTDTYLAAGEAMFISVMTLDKNGNPRKLCDLAVTREQLQSALDLVGKPRS